jgi:hypothetical protein
MDKLIVHIIMVIWQPSIKHIPNCELVCIKLLSNICFIAVTSKGPFYLFSITLKHYKNSQLRQSGRVFMSKSIRRWTSGKIIKTYLSDIDVITSDSFEYTLTI